MNAYKSIIKYLVASVLLIALIASAGCSIQVGSVVYNEDSDGGLVITSADKQADAVISGYEYGGKSVVAVKARAFRNDTAVKLIELPHTVRTIGKEAFSGCTALELLCVPGSCKPYLDASGIYESAPECTVLIFESDGIECSITGAIDNGGILTIPESICGIPVRYIGDGAFRGMSFTSAVIPEGVKQLGAGAFYQCTALESVIMPSTLDMIGDRAFADCTALVDIDISNVKTAGTQAFADCTSLESITLCAETDGIPDGMVSGCTALKTIEYAGDSPLYIGDGALSGCIALEKFDMPVWHIGNEALTDCTALKWVTLPANEDVLNAYAAAASGLEADVYIPESEIVIPSAISAYAVIYSENEGEGGISINGVMLPRASINIADVVDGKPVTAIEGGAFAEMSGLMDVTIPASVTYIGGDAFAGTAYMDAIRSGGEEFTLTAGGVLIAYNGAGGEITVPEGTVSVSDAFVGTSATSVILPEGLLSIASGAFDGCGSMSEINVPASVMRIGDGAFEGCNKLLMICGDDSYAASWADKAGVLHTADANAVFVDIFDAMEQGMIEVSAVGDSITSSVLTVKNLTGAPLYLRLELGAWLSSESSRVQNMLIRDEYVIFAEAGETVDTEVASACMNIKLHVPDGEDVFMLDKDADKRLVDAVRALLEQDANFDTIQAAVWIITDGASFADSQVLISYGVPIVSPEEYAAAEAAVNTADNAG